MGKKADMVERVKVVKAVKMEEIVKMEKKVEKLETKRVVKTGWRRQ